MDETHAVAALSASRKSLHSIGLPADHVSSNHCIIALVLAIAMRIRRGCRERNRAPKNRLLIPRWFDLV
jgi:hypothetical protein